MSERNVFEQLLQQYAMTEPINLRISLGAIVLGDDNAGVKA